MTMGLLQMAVKTFDTMFPVIGFDQESRYPLAPVAHTVRQADIEITIDGDGAFIDVRQRRTKFVKGKKGRGGVVDEPDLDAEPKIVVPVTEESLGRTSAAARLPHYLCDNLEYMLSDNRVQYEAYVSQLAGWVESEYTHPKAKAVLAYVRGGTIVRDLSNRNLVELNEDGMPVNQKLFICWNVYVPGDMVGACHHDLSLMKSLTDYHMHRISMTGKQGLCMLTGKTCTLATQHAKGISGAEPNAKLISFNSSSNNTFTYKGRFLTADEAVSIGYEASQKAHNALAWLVANKGVTVGSRIFLCWNPNGHEVPDVTAAFIQRQSGGVAITDENVYQRELRSSVFGWKSKLSDDEDVVFAVLDPATPGCLSILYYSEMSARDYISRLEEWESVCRCGTVSPGLGTFVRYAYGTPRDGKYEIAKKIHESHLYRMVVTRMEGLKFPQDIKDRLVDHASNLVLCSSEGIKGKGASPRKKLLQTACSAVRKYRYDVKGEDFSMSWDPNCKDRSYLFGAVLAVLDRVEYLTYDRETKRETAAMRYQKTFSQQPSSTLKLIHDSLGPYFAKLSPAQRIYYRNELGMLMDSMSPSDRSDKPLGDLYLMGYYHKREAMRFHKADGAEKGSDQGVGSEGNDMAVSVPAEEDEI